ncbi:MAG: FHIPEP family type III secretion protein [Kistimonas sp.]|nr:FHIPEP family type III secretion protein [Kistimonas sp.]
MKAGDKFSFNIGSIVLALILPTIILITLPGPVIDIFILVSFTSSALLLMITLENDNPLNVTFLPTFVLLLTTFRLLLSIATTKNIIANENVGSVIEAVGSFVMGGNLFSGLLIFIIITIVQFLVVTKGGERVAEVSARFSLDALPGKQMTIDGDLKSGLITGEQAKMLRSDLGIENKLFGSLDGAMKFVKGDAIAGIIISLVNLFGGIYVGINQFGYSLAESVSKFSVLTIGDGLVSQIPSLLLSMACGVYLTRIKSEYQKTGAFVGQMLGQVNKFWKSLSVLSAIIMFLGLGNTDLLLSCFPLSLSLAALAFYLYKDQGKPPEEDSGEEKVSQGVFSTLSIKVAQRNHHEIIKKIAKEMEHQLWNVPLGHPVVDVDSNMEHVISITISNVEIFTYSPGSVESSHVVIMDDDVFYHSDNIDYNVRRIASYFLKNRVVAKYNLEHTKSILDALGGQSETIKSEVESAIGMGRVHDIVKEMLSSPEFYLDMVSFFEAVIYWSKIDSDSSNWFTRVRPQAKYEITERILMLSRQVVALVPSESYLGKVQGFVSGQNENVDELIAFRQFTRNKVISLLTSEDVALIVVTNQQNLQAVKTFFQRALSTLTVCSTEDLASESFVTETVVLDEEEA